MLNLLTPRAQDGASPPVRGKLVPNARLQIEDGQVSFIETIERARILLERNGRLSIRALQREFDLDAEALEELVEELVDVQQIAAREGKILSWLGDRLAPALERVAERDPRDYTPKYLAEKILRSRSALEGERKHVTVLFADVKDSMELARRVGAEDWHRILDRFFGILTSGVHRFEGTVNQYTGDGIMALFGAPVAHEDHAQRACYAALHLRDALNDYAAELQRSRGLDFAVRMGIHTGEVVVGRIGDDLRMDYTAQGHSVGLAQRLEQMAPARSIYLSNTTAQLVSGYFDLRDRGTASAKGARDPLGVFELVDLGSHRTRLDVARSRGLTRFVGRAADLQSLEGALEQACAGHGQVVGVVAEAGVGKSRLCLEFVEHCRARAVRVHEGHCPSHGETIPLLPLLELLRSVFGIGEGESGAAARGKIEDELQDLEEGFRPLLPLLFDLLGVPDPERRTSMLSPEVRERQLSALLRHLVRERSEREPRVLFIDDAHWIDRASDAYLAQMIEAVPGTRTLLVVNFRPEYQADWMGRSHYRQLPLLPLGPKSTAELLADLLGSDSSLAGLADEIHERTQGNPFFVEEVVQSLVERGCLVGEKGAYRRVVNVAELAIPDGVHAVLAARIDRLPEREKRLLQTASVVGRHVAGPVLERVAGLPEADLSNALALLVRREFLFEESLHPQSDYAFKHPLTHEVAYHSQLGEARARTHGMVAEALEAVHAGELDEQAALLAYHWEQAGEPLAAARWNLRAAARSEKAFEVQWAILYWRKARALVAEAPESEERDEIELEACRRLVTFLAWQGAAEEEMTSLFARGCALAEACDERRVLGQLHMQYGVWRGFSCNDITGMGGHVRQAAELAAQVDDAGIAVVSAAGLALLGYTEGRLSEAIEIGRRALERAPDDPLIGSEYFTPPPAMWLNGFVLSLETWAGRPAESLAALRRTFEHARSVDSEVFLVIASLWSGQAAEVLGDISAVMDHAQRIASFLQKVGMSLGGSDHYFHGIGHLLGGNPAQAVTHLERARDIHEAAPAAPLDVVGSWSRLAVAYAELGDVERARATSERAVALTRERLPVMVPPALTMHARVLRKTGGAGERSAIEAALVEAERLSERIGIGCCRPFIHVERAALAGILGDEATFEREGRAAQRGFSEMGAVGHAERFARELARLS
jgi:class 3 adenylate cyclase/tetratricopeptide (TPR) repeat protein